MTAYYVICPFCGKDNTCIPVLIKKDGIDFFCRNCRKGFDTKYVKSENTEKSESKEE